MNGGGAVRIGDDLGEEVLGFVKVEMENESVAAEAVALKRIDAQNAAADEQKGQDVPGVLGGWIVEQALEVVELHVAGRPMRTAGLGIDGRGLPPADSIVGGAGPGFHRIVAADNLSPFGNED